MRFVLFILMISGSYAAEFNFIKDDIKGAKLIVIGNVIESIENNHLVKIDKWAMGTPKSKFVKVHTSKNLERLQTYMFAIDDVKGDYLWINDAQKGVYELKSMGDYNFLVRAYNSDKPLIGQIELDSLVDYFRKDLNVQMKSRSFDQFDRKVAQISNIAKRSPASSAGAVKSQSKISEVWLIVTFCFLILVPVVFRKTRL